MPDTDTAMGAAMRRALDEKTASHPITMPADIAAAPTTAIDVGFDEADQIYDLTCGGVLLASVDNVAIAKYPNLLHELVVACGKAVETA